MNRLRGKGPSCEEVSSLQYSFSNVQSRARRSPADNVPVLGLGIKLHSVGSRGKWV